MELKDDWLFSFPLPRFSRPRANTIARRVQEPKFPGAADGFLPACDVELLDAMNNKQEQLRDQKQIRKQSLR